MGLYQAEKECILAFTSDKHLFQHAISFLNYVAQALECLILLQGASSDRVDCYLIHKSQKLRNTINQVRKMRR